MLCTNDVDLIVKLIHVMWKKFHSVLPQAQEILLKIFKVRLRSSQNQN